MPNRNTTTSAAGDAFAVGGFDDLYRSEYAAMVKLAQGLVDSLDRAEEIVQDAFAKVFERWHRLDEPGGYLRVSVVNGARSELRKREVRRRLGFTRRGEEPVEQRDYLIDALEQLSVNQRTVLVLRFYADLSEREIADALNMRPGTVKSTASRGLRNLRRALEQ